MCDVNVYGDDPNETRNSLFGNAVAAFVRHHMPGRKQQQ
jgi:hypothetical protein